MSKERLSKERCRGAIVVQRNCFALGRMGEKGQLWRQLLDLDRVVATGGEYANVRN